MTLGREGHVVSHECVCIQFRAVRQVALQQCVLQRRGDVATGVLQQRHQVVRGGAVQGVLEVEQAAGGHAVPVIEQHQVVDVEVAQHHGLATPGRRFAERGEERHIALAQLG
ncbi:hypothetical protein FQZ97_920550 [compost metagenome]